MTPSGLHTSSARGVWADVVAYVLRRPPQRTHLSLSTAAERENYDHRILQRLNISVADYSVLNVHKIGITAPATFVWDMLTRWSPEAGYWPNHLARAVFARGLPNHVEILLFGLDFIPLFKLDILRRQPVPLPTAVDNARYILYRCRGGYPLGVFSMYLRSNIASQQERETTQLFFVVSFDFFGRKDWLGARAVRPIWESIHDRVTAHSLNRFKTHCETAFARLQSGRDPE